MLKAEYDMMQGLLRPPPRKKERRAFEGHDARQSVPLSAACSRRLVRLQESKLARVVNVDFASILSFLPFSFFFFSSPRLSIRLSPTPLSLPPPSPPLNLLDESSLFAFGLSSGSRRSPALPCLLVSTATRPSRGATGLFWSLVVAGRRGRRG